MAYGSFGDIMRSLSARSPLAEASVPPVAPSDFVAASVMQWEQPAPVSATIAVLGPRMPQIQVAELQAGQSGTAQSGTDRPAMEFLIGLPLPKLTQPGTPQIQETQIQQAQIQQAQSEPQVRPVEAVVQSPVAQAPVAQAPVVEAQAAPQSFFFPPRSRPAAQRPLRPQPQFQMPWQIGVFQ